jgi:dephospho-CoA kinase
MKRVLLAGGLGTGKTTIGGMLTKMGAFVIDADLVGQRVLESDGPAYEAVVGAFPDAIVGGRIDRRVLAEIVFLDPGALEQLEKLTHPAIHAEIETLVGSAQARVVVVEVPLMRDFLGPGWTRVVADAPDDIRLRRAVARGMEEDDARRRMQAQPEREAWLAWADIVIPNPGSLEALARRVSRFWALLTD